jgi:hypothetical protein
MKSFISVGGLVVLLYTVFSLSSCATQQEEAKAPPAKPAATAEAKKAPAAEKAPSPAKAETKAEAKAPAKAKAEKAKGDVGLLDSEKNYLILVTKEGKLITLDYDQKTKATMLEAKPAKVSDVSLGAAADVEYVTKGDKKIVTKMEFRKAKGGD